MWTNWSKNVKISAPVLQPKNIDELYASITGIEYGLVGGGFSFNSMIFGSNPDLLISLKSLDDRVTFSKDNSEVTISPSTTLAKISVETSKRNLQILNYPSCLDFSVIGSIATGSHGSGPNACLASMVTKYSLLDRQSGNIEEYDENNGNFFNNLILPNRKGIITSLTLQVVCATTFSRLVFGGVSWKLIPKIVNYLSEKKSNFSIYLNLGDESRNSLILTLESKNIDHFTNRLSAEFPMLFIGKMSSRGLSVQKDEHFKKSGFAHEVIPHSSIALPSTGEELQSEYFVLESDFEIVYRRLLYDVSNSLLNLIRSIELRFVENNKFHLSPSYGVNVIAIHVTWRNNLSEVSTGVAQLEKVIKIALNGGFLRVHWGKIFSGPLTEWMDTF